MLYFPSRLTIGAFLALILCGLGSPYASTAEPDEREAVEKTSPRRLRVLFLGDRGHHQPAARAQQILPYLTGRGIDISYTERLESLNPETLSRYDCLLVYANQTHIEPDQEQALLDFVAGGKGFVPIHCASYCFLNSPRYIELVGAQFASHGTGTFKVNTLVPDHPAIDQVPEFESWDETYVHQQHNPDRIVLAERVEGDLHEPWTWVRKYGKGRVFYTAWGHDERTWSNPGFEKLLERGARWAAGDWALEADVEAPPFEYVEADIPNYVPSARHGTLGDAIRQMQLPLSAEASHRRMVPAAGFETRLFASEPDIFKPIAIAWDERGRLWVAETLDYPNELQPSGEGHDRISICEDTDHDGRADRFTVFADELSIPTSLVPVRRGVIVTQVPDIVLLSDTDGDDRADRRAVLFSGFGTGDTHAGPSNLRWGCDNWIWGTVGYSGFEGRVGEEEHRFSQGLFRFRPDGSRLEFLGSTSNNTWGLGFSEEGLVFGSTANGSHSLYLPIPNRYFESIKGGHGVQVPAIADHRLSHPITSAVRQVDFHGGFTAAAGHALYTARGFPREYWNRIAFVCEPTAHVVHQCLLDPQGSGFVSGDGWNLVASDDEWTAPIAAEVGPDGNVWMVDWYNFIVQHNPTPAGFETGRGNAYVTPLRDKSHGRIYRVLYSAGPHDVPLDLARANAKQLVAALAHPNMFWRLTAQRLLVERGKRDVVPMLAKAVEDSEVDAIGLCPAAMHALWTLDGLGTLDGTNPVAVAAVHAGLRHEAPGVRRAAAMVAPRSKESLAAILKARLLDDENPHVRQEALLALSEMPASKAAAKAIAGMMGEEKNSKDAWIPSAATAAAAKNDRAFLVAATAQEVAAESVEAFAAVVRTVAEHYARGNSIRPAASLVVEIEQGDVKVVEAVLAGLAAGSTGGLNGGSAGNSNSADGLKSDRRTEASLSKLLERLPASGQLALVSLSRRWGIGGQLDAALESVRTTLLSQVEDESQPDDTRLAAAGQLVTVGMDQTTVDDLVGLITPKTSPELAAGLLDAIGQSGAEDACDAIIAAWPQLTPGPRRTAMPLLLSRPKWTLALVSALENGAIDPADLTNDQVQQLMRHPDAAIAAAASEILKRSGNVPSPDRQKVLDALLPLAERTGDATLGKAVFEKNCAKCHRLGEIGEQIGPDLTGIAVRKRAEILTEILDPNRSVEGNYRQYTAVTTDGRVLSGLLKNETKTSFELLDNEAKRHVLLREDVDELAASTLSVMPEGFEKLTEVELVSLLEFLSARGKYFPLPLGKAATVASTRGMFYDQNAEVERLVFPTWGQQTAFDVPFWVIDPRDATINNCILLYGPLGAITREMPRSASVPCNSAARAIHLLGGVSGWGFPFSEKGSVSMIVRLHYADGQTEDHELLNGVHLADYIRVVEVPESKLAFKLRGQQLRYLSIEPRRAEVIDQIEFVKGPDDTAPLVMAVTVERPE